MRKKEGYEKAKELTILAAVAIVFSLLILSQTFGSQNNTEEGTEDKENLSSVSGMNVEFIKVTKAVLFTKDREVIAEITPIITTQDQNWTNHLLNSEIIEVTFEKNLSTENDITIYAKKSGPESASIEVYTKGSTEKIAQFPNITTEGYYRINLSRLNGAQDTFDLKITTQTPRTTLLVDFIIDPAINFVVNNEANDMDMAILNNDTGLFVLAWCDDTDDAAKYRVNYANGSAYGAVTTFDAGAGDNCKVSIAALNETAFVIGYLDWANPTSSWSIVGYDIENNQVIPLFTIDNNIGNFADVGICSLGNQTYATIAMDDNDNDVTFDIYQMSTQIVGQIDVDIDTPPIIRGNDVVDCAALTNDRWVIAYYDANPREIAFAIYDASGNQIKARTTISATNVIAAVSVTALRNGGFAVMYVDSDETNIEYSIYDSNGDLVGSEQTIAPNGAFPTAGQSGTHIDVGALYTTDSRFVTMYDRDNGDNVSINVYNYSSTEILARTTLDRTDTIKKSVVVLGYDHIQEKTICEHEQNPMIVGYNNQTGPNSIWYPLYSDGTVWDGICQDTTAPTVLIETPLNMSWTNSATTDFNYTPEDNSELTSCELVLNNAEDISTTTVTIGQLNNFTKTLADGIYNWTVNCTDNPTMGTGNEGIGNETRVINVDTTDPGITLNAPNDGNITISRDVTFNFTPSDNLAGTLNCSLMINDTINQTNGTSPNNTAITFDVTSFNDGIYVWNITCLDLAQNSFTSPTQSFEINISPYLGGIDIAPAIVQGGNNVTITANNEDDPDLGILSLYCDSTVTPTAANTDCVGGVTQDITAPYALTCIITSPLVDQLNTVYCRVFDNMGYSSEVKSATYSTDSIGPRVNVSHVPTTFDDLDPNVTINVSANITDNVDLASVILQFREENGAFSDVAMTNVAPGDYIANFTPNTTNNWTYRINVTNINGLMNITPNTTLEIEFDQSWTIDPSGFGAVAGNFNTVVSLVNITVNNTGDFRLEFTYISNRPSLLEKNETTPFTLNPKETKTIQVNATVPTVEAEYPINITIGSTNATAVPVSRPSDGVLVASEAGAYLYVTINDYDPDVTVGDIVNLSATVENLAEDARNAWFMWQLPNGWTNTTGPVNVTIGILGFRDTATNNLTVQVGGNTGTIILTARAGADANEVGNATRNVTVQAAQGGNGNQNTAGGGGGGGGGGSPRPINPDKEITNKLDTELISSEESFELIRGKTMSFPITITNVYQEFTLHNVTLNVGGYLGQYLQISPVFIDEIKTNETKTFNVTITSPEYMTQETYDLIVTIDGMLLGIAQVPYNTTTVRKTQRVKLIDTRLVTLLIREIENTDAYLLLTESAEDIQAMKNAGFGIQKVTTLYLEMERAYDAKDYETLTEYHDEIRHVRETAFNTDDLLESINREISEAEEKELNVEETKKVVKLANAAFGREDYETAYARAKEAQLILFLETKAELNLIKFAKDHWIILLLLLSGIGIITYRSYVRIHVIVITRTLYDLFKEETTIKELMVEIQKKCFVDKKMSVSSYHKAMYQYERRLGEIRETKARLRKKRQRLLTFEQELSYLRKEKEELILGLKQLQENYFIKKKIGTKEYKVRTEEYTMHRAEIEEQIALIEAKLAHLKVQENVQRKEQLAIQGKTLGEIIRSSDSACLKFWLLLKKEQLYEKISATCSKMKEMVNNDIEYIKTEVHIMLEKVRQKIHWKVTAHQYGKEIIVLCIVAGGLLTPAFLQYHNASPSAYAVFNTTEQQDSIGNEESTVPLTKEQAQELLNLGAREIALMNESNLKTVYVTDQYLEATAAFEREDYDIVQKETELISKRREQGLLIIDLISVEYEETKKFENTTGLNASHVYTLLERAKQELESERYEKAEQLIKQAETKRDEIQAESTRISAVYNAKKQKTWEWIKAQKQKIVLSIIGSIILGSIIGYKIKKHLLKKKIKGMIIERYVLNTLIQQAQVEHYQKKTITKLMYDAKMKKYKQRLLEIDEQLPVLKERYKKGVVATKEEHRQIKQPIYAEKNEQRQKSWVLKIPGVGYIQQKMRERAWKKELAGMQQELQKYKGQKTRT